MLSKIKNLDPNTKLVAKAVAIRIALPVVAVIVTQVIMNKIDKNQEAIAE